MNIILTGKLIFAKLNPSNEFVFKITKSKIQQVKGKDQLKFLNDCQDIIHEHGITSGLICGAANGDGIIRIKLSREINQDSAQKFRNLWSFYS